MGCNLQHNVRYMKLCFFFIDKLSYCTAYRTTIMIVILSVERILLMTTTHIL